MPGRRHYRARLSPQGRRAYDALARPWGQGLVRAGLTLPGAGFRLADGTPLHAVAQAVLLDSPLIFHLDTRALGYIRRGSRVRIEAAGLYPPGAYGPIRARLLARAEELLAPMPRGGEAARLAWIFDTLVWSAEYGTGCGSPLALREAQTAVGALLGGSCLCQGFAQAMALLCALAGLRCLVAVGRAELPHGAGPRPHAWNIVRVAGTPYHVDTALAACGLGQREDWLMRSDRALAANHRWHQETLPPCPRDGGR